MTHPQMIAPAWAEQPTPPECPRCGDRPHGTSQCVKTPTPKDPHAHRP